MTTEAEAFASIVTWSADQPAWQRDALRRLVLQQGIETDEIDQLAAICKGVEKAVPLEAGHLSDPNRDHGDVYLRGVSGVRHVSALAPGQRLSVRKDGLTVVYGDNGSGKSGYARILKKACRARGAGSKVEEVIPDIYDQNPGTPTANIEYSIGGQNRVCSWTLGSPADGALSGVSVFDSRTANVHVDDTNDVAYTPFPLKVLGQLAVLCRHVKERLAAEIGRLKDQTPHGLNSPTCSADTEVGRLIAALSGNTDTAKIETLSTLSQEESDRLAQLTSDLADDPQRLARQLAALKGRTLSQIQKLDLLVGSVSDANFAHLDQLRREATIAREAADAASAALFRDEPIPQIGTEAWQTLWESARAFSQQDTYPSREFPATDDGDVCVLCQQELSSSAIERLNRFEAFVQNDSQVRADESRQRFNAAVELFEAARLSFAELEAIEGSIRDDLQQAALADEVRTAVVRSVWRHRQIRRSLREGLAVRTEASAYNKQGLLDCISGLDRRAEGLMADAGSSERAALLNEKAVLADRQWLAGMKADVLAEVSRRKEIAGLEKAQRDTATTKITSKSTEVAAALVTDALRAQFTREVDSFGIAGLALELRQQSSSQGVPRFKVALVRRPDARVAQVLSEGEYRCTALAAFMAELSTTESRSGIVFDDPVSSLDHMHREAVAKRLVAEAASRQIVVFTHDLAFLFELQQAARDMGLDAFDVSSVAKGTDRAGFTYADPPFKARKVEQIVASLTNQLNNERQHCDQGNEEAWRNSIKSIVGTLRDTWEIAVEQAVSHVIRRLSNKVDTGKLIKLTVITPEDCEAMRDGYGRCSELLHSSARELNRGMPRPDAVEREIKALSDWIADLKTRQDRAKLN